MPPSATCEHLTQKQRVDQDAGRDSCTLGIPGPGSQDLSRVAGYWDGPSSGHPPWGQRQGWINTINLQVCVFFFPIAEYFCFLLFISIRTLKLCFNSEKNMHLYFDLLTIQHNYHQSTVLWVCRRLGHWSLTSSTEAWGKHRMPISCFLLHVLSNSTWILEFLA